MSEIAVKRLMEERRNWRLHPIYGFIARPTKNEDGPLNLFSWRCIIPGKKGTAWEDGKYVLSVIFSHDYPSSPPKCTFTPPIYHVNVHPTGAVYCAMLDEKKAWCPSLSLGQMLMGVQNLLTVPDTEIPANMDAFTDYVSKPLKYDYNVRQQARKFNGMF